MPKFQSQAQREAETFFGTILKNGENFVLSHSATKSQYVLDSPQKVSRFEEMTVKATFREPRLGSAGAVRVGS